MRLNRGRLGNACLAKPAIVSVVLLFALAGLVLFMGPKAPVARSVGSVQPFASASPSMQHQAHPALVAYSHLPLMFEPNQGQTDPRVKFLAHGASYGLFLTADGAVLTLRHSASSSSPGMSVLRMGLIGANSSAPVSGSDELASKSNYFIGNDPSRWHTSVPQFARVHYRSVYPGVDLVYYGKQGQLEYDFEVAPRGDPDQVALRFDGTKRLKIESNGDLVVDSGGSDVRLHAPRVYQKIGTEERSIAGRFALRGKSGTEVRFELGDYDRTRTLIIDPVLTYSHLLGGSGLESCSAILGQTTPITPGCPAIAVDPASNAYIAGSTTSTDFPMTIGEFQPGFVPGAMANAYVAKFDGNGVLKFATYIGGDHLDYTAGVAVDNGLNITVAGTTTSTNFPTNGANAPFQATPVSANPHVFVSQLSSDGKTLLYSTYLSGNGVDVASGLALDPGGTAYVTGSTGSSNFPTTVGAYQTAPKAGTHSQAFFSRVDTAASGNASLLYSTYIGGSSPSTGVVVGGGIAVDSNANAYITGGTNFIDFPVLNAYQGTLKSTAGTNAFVTKINPAGVTGAQLLYSTYFGGTGTEVGYGVALDSSTDAYITGSTTSPSGDIVIPTGTTPFLQCIDEPTNTPLPCPTVTNPVSDAFLAKFGVLCTGTTCTVTTLPLNYFTYLGGTGRDLGTAVAVDTNQGARITGWTDSTDFPLVNPIQSVTGGGIDAFVARIDTLAGCTPINNTSCPATSTSTYLGGSALDVGTSIAVDQQGSSFVTGETASSNFPAPGSTLNGTSDAFVSKFGPTLALLMPTPTVTPSPVGVGGVVSFVYTITNNGDFTNGVQFIDFLPATGATFGTATVSQGTCGAPTGSPPTVLCSIGALNTAATATVTITVTPVAPPVPGGSLLLGNSGSASVNGLQLATSSNSAMVNDFSIAAAPAAATVPAGVPATFTATVTPSANNGFPGSVSLTCSTALPTGVTCVAGNNNPIPNLNSGAQQAQLILNTTARVTTTTELRRGAPFYALWLPISGLTLVGMGVGRRKRRRRVLMAVLLGCFFALTLFQAACGSSKHTSTTTGTPAGTYPITITATSGSGAVRTALVTLNVQ